jgi:hypothetical protein
MSLARIATCLWPFALCACGAPPYIPVLVPAHTERLYAPVCFPAETADGRLLSTNGGDIFVLDADGTVLDIAPSPLGDVSASEAAGRGPWPTTVASNEGAAYLVGSDGRVCGLNSDGSAAWTKDLGGRVLAALPMDGGIGVGLELGGYRLVKLTPDGAEAWTYTPTFDKVSSMQAKPYLGGAVAMVSHEAAFAEDDIFSVSGTVIELEAISASGEIQFSKRIRELQGNTIFNIFLEDPAGSEIAVRDKYNIVLVNAAGEPRAFESSGGMILSMALLSADRFITSHTEDAPPYHYYYLICDGLGQVKHRTGATLGMGRPIRMDDLRFYASSTLASTGNAAVWSAQSGAIEHSVDLPTLVKVPPQKPGGIWEIYAGVNNWSQRLGKDATIYVEVQGGLAAVSPDGVILWTLKTQYYTDQYVKAHME